MKITIIGAGNMGGALARGLVRSGCIPPQDLTCTARSQRTLDRMHEFNADVRLSLDNTAAVADADLIVIAVKPWRVEVVAQQIKPLINPQRQMVVSIAAGIGTEALQNFFRKDDGKVPTIFYVIPNTAIEVRSSMTFITSSNATPAQIEQLMTLFNYMGYTQFVEERLMRAGTALASCGIGYAFRYIRATIEGGVEMGFYPEEAQEIVLRTVKGAVDLLLANHSNPEQEIDKVTTPGGITIKGLNEMESAGFSASVIRGLKAGL